jgi:hypothetical protein
VADQAYLCLLEEERARARMAWLGAHILRAGHLSRADGSDIEAPDPGEQREHFDELLRQPLNHERVRAAILREVSEA